VSWLRLDVEIADAHVDEVGDLLLGLGASSASVTSAQPAHNRVLEPDPGVTPLWQRCRLSALLPLETDLSLIRAGLAPFGARVLDTDFVEDANWLESWRQYAVQECFAGRLWLLPRDAPPVAQPALRLNPGLAFGTGAHPTTRLCLEWLAAEDLRGLSVLDFGCGSGVLGLAACVLGARDLVAVDHDPQACDATRDNAAFNGLSAQVTVGDAEVSGGRAYDVIVANILARPLVELADRLMSLLRPEGRLLLSGLLSHQAGEVVAAYPQVQFAEPRVAGDWICLVGCRQAA
jgi:ribosomal protein L11 methyltransferase